MRLRITRAISGRFAGVQLGEFVVGRVYDVSTAVGSFMVSVRAAVPILTVSADLSATPSED